MQTCLESGGLHKVAGENLGNIGDGNFGGVLAMGDGHGVGVLEQHWVKTVPLEAGGFIRFILKVTLLNSLAENGKGDKLPEVRGVHEEGDQFAGNIPVLVVEQGELPFRAQRLGKVQVGNRSQFLDRNPNVHIFGKTITHLVGFSLVAVRIEAIREFQHGFPIVPSGECRLQGTLEQ